MVDRMTTYKPENPPAFPRPFSEDRHSGDRPEHYEAQAGMTLRDYFAAAALQGQMAGADWGDCSSHVASARAYKYADAMLAAREQTRKAGE